MISVGWRFFDGIPLTHPPGRRLEADFGHIYVDFPQARQQVAVLLLRWSHSGYRFAVALPGEQTEAILAGMVQGFDFFGCVPWEIWWDNPTTAATAVLEGRQRQVQPRYAALASHYCFDLRFCMPARGNEKPYVEHSVYDLQRDWATPGPPRKMYRTPLVLPGNAPPTLASSGSWTWAGQTDRYSPLNRVFLTLAGPKATEEEKRRFRGGTHLRTAPRRTKPADSRTPAATAPPGDLPAKHSAYARLFPGFPGMNRLFFIART